MIKKLIFLSPFLMAMVSLFCGSFGMSFSETLAHLLGWLQGEDTRETLVLSDVRMPRIILSGLVGMSLAASGSSLQAVLKNPLVDPFILGISSGAAFGCALSIAFLPALPLPISAFVFGCIAVFITYSLARTRGEISRLTLVLSGVVVSSLFGALLSSIKFLVEPTKLQNIVFWLMGSFALSDWPKSLSAGLGAIIGLTPLIVLRWHLNVLSLGDHEAKTLGLNVNLVRVIIISGSTLAVTSAVSVSGIIGWVGLMTPHFTRMLLGPDHKQLLPYSMYLGASIMIGADTISRSISSYDFPVGIVTALVGAPFFIFLMKKTGQGNWD
jgi:iron complex transport system permease protein